MNCWNLERVSVCKYVMILSQSGKQTKTTSLIKAIRQKLMRLISLSLALISSRAAIGLVFAHTQQLVPRFQSSLGSPPQAHNVIGEREKLYEGWWIINVVWVRRHRHLQVWPVWKIASNILVIFHRQKIEENRRWNEAASTSRRAEGQVAPNPLENSETRNFEKRIRGNPDDL